MDRLQELVRLHRMGTGAREVARMLRMSPNTEREYRQALEKEGLLDGPAENIAALEVLKAAVERQLPVVAPPQMVGGSAAAELEHQVGGGQCSAPVGWAARHPRRAPSYHGCFLGKP